MLTRKGWTIRAGWGMLVVSPFLGGAMGCTCKGLDTGSQIGISHIPDPQTGGLRARLWASSDRFGAVSFLEGSHSWRDPGLAMQTRLGVTAASWSGAEDRYERVYFVGRAGADRGVLHEVGSGPSPNETYFSWRVAAAADTGEFVGPMAAVIPPEAVGEDPQRWVGIVVAHDDGKPRLWIMTNATVNNVHTLSPEWKGEFVLAPNAVVLGTHSTGVLSMPWYFVVDDAGRLHSVVRLPNSGDTWVDSVIAPPADVPDLKLDGDGAAVQWTNVDGYNVVSAVVRDTQDRLWEARLSLQFVGAQWNYLADGLSGGRRFGVAAAPRLDDAGGFDVAFVGAPYIHYRRYVASTETWTNPAVTAKPDDLAGPLTGPILLDSAPGGGTTAHNPTVYLIGRYSSTDNTSGQAYAFVHVSPEPGLPGPAGNPAQEWNNLLDPAIASGIVNVNKDGYWTESSADEKEGNMLVASMELHDEGQLPLAPMIRVRAAWSHDDGHSWDHFTNFDTPFKGGPGGAQDGAFWLQGDPSAVLLNTNPETGYVMFHEFRLSPAAPGQTCAKGINPLFCRTAVRLLRVTPTSAPELVDTSNLADWWEVQASDPGDLSCDSTNGAWIDHPSMAIGPDDWMHFAWRQLGTGIEPPGLYYAAMDGVFNAIAFPSAVPLATGEISFEQPYVLADQHTSGVSYVIARDVQQAYSGVLAPVFKCTVSHYPTYPPNVAKCEPSPAAKDKDFRTDWWTQPFNKNEVLHNLRGPMLVSAISTGHDSAPTLAIAAVARPKDAGYDAIRSIRVATWKEGAAEWSFGTVPKEDPNVDHFAPTLAVLPSGSIAVQFYETTRPSARGSVKIAVRDADGTWQQPLPTIATDFDLGLSGHHCADGEFTHFNGDYHISTGGRTHTHFMRSEALPNQFAGIECSGACLFHGAISDRAYACTSPYLCK